MKSLLCACLFLLVFVVVDRTWALSNSDNDEDGTLYVSVRVIDDETVSIVQSSATPFDPSNDFDAFASYQDMNQTNTGWGLLRVRSNPFSSDEAQMLASGFAEGFLTATRIFHVVLNTNPRSAVNANLSAFIEANNDFMKQNIDSSSRFATDQQRAYWHQVSLTLTQVHGVYLGYRAACFDYSSTSSSSSSSSDPTAPPCDAVTELDLLLLQMSGDLEDLLSALSLDSNNPDQLRVLSSTGTGHCSSLIRLLDDFSDVYASQVTWNDFGSMIRIFKYYDFALRLYKGTQELAPANSVSFSSYPGVILSGDDYYVTSQNLVVMETTIGNANNTLYQLYVKPNTVLDWLRNVVANRLAHTAKEWTDIFSLYNSGTYNNEWLIVDMKQFEKGSAPGAGFLYVLDQIPGYIVAEDLTQLLIKQSYFPSYNVPYFPLIYNLSGAAAMASQGGDWFSYDKTPRALIFKRDAPTVSTVDDMKKLMRYNDFQHDPLSICNCTPIGASGENAISARSDLNPIDGTYSFGALGHRSHGGTDAKLTAASLFNLASSSPQTTWTVAGPTHDQQPVFDWSTATFIPNVTHIGHPQRFDFDWQLLQF